MLCLWRESATLPGFAAQTAYEAGRLTLGYFGTEAARPEFKADDTPVTVADREAEKLIRERIETRYPSTRFWEKSTGRRRERTRITVGSSTP